MADVKVIIDGNEYSEEEFRKDLIRMLDAYRDKDAQMGVPECSGVECYVCPLYKNSCCKRRTTNSFKTIGLVYNWAKEHPVITNKDMLKKTFGKDVIHYIEARPYKEEWLDEEYKEPSKEQKGDKKNG